LRVQLERFLTSTPLAELEVRLVIENFPPNIHLGSNAAKWIDTWFGESSVIEVVNKRATSSGFEVDVRGTFLEIMQELQVRHHGISVVKPIVERLPESDHELQYSEAPIQPRPDTRQIITSIHPVLKGLHRGISVNFSPFSRRYQIKVVTNNVDLVKKKLREAGLYPRIDSLNIKVISSDVAGGGTFVHDNLVDTYVNDLSRPS
tara:strand:+ start:799 stop:1410 length:612 start_codon:yes stop_codon:yes gene_type:complete